MRGKLARPVRGGVARKRTPQGTPRRAAYSTPTLHQQLAALPWRPVPDATRDTGRGHGRREIRTLEILTVSTGIAFPHAAQVIQIRRRRHRNPTAPNGLAGVRTVVPTLEGFRWTPAQVVEQGDLVMTLGRLEGVGPGPMIIADVFRLESGRIVEHWDVVQAEVAAADTVSGNPML